MCLTKQCGGLNTKGISTPAETKGGKTRQALGCGEATGRRAGNRGLGMCAGTGAKTEANFI